MRRFITCTGVALAVSTLLTSCLKEVNNVFNPGATPAVTQTLADGTMVANTRYGLVYAGGLSSNNSGKCLLVDFTYDASDPEMMNVKGNGYYTVRLQNQQPVDQQDIKPELTDPGSLLPNEQPVMYGISPVEENQTYFDFINGYLFLPSEYISTESQRVEWEMSYDPTAAPSQVDGKPVYNLYLRATAASGRTEGAEEVGLVTLNAFNLAPLMETSGHAAGTREELYIAIHYINRINALDSAQFAWAVTEPLHLK